eukprot:TRINITY_DN101351_c0_g1_i1.p1 TRINITY_DN101351_c0_g1~~TRINITY_DN101351_c0_g1_i1.p1  ORF type:complete len:388 (-),score=82.01 TRINITY_DN101351_c0_g1_i1:5-1168(-)
MGRGAVDALFASDDEDAPADAEGELKLPQQHVSFEHATKFIRMCRLKPERLRLLCSTSAFRKGGDRMAVFVEVTPEGKKVEVHEVSMSEGWTGCRFSPCSLWLALSLGQSLGPSGSAKRRPQTALELGCGVALSGLAAHTLGVNTTVTDCLGGHLRSLEARASSRLQADPGAADLRVRRLDWIEEVGSAPAVVNQLGTIDRGSPENLGLAADGRAGGAQAPTDSAVEARGPPEQWPRLTPEEVHSFDLVLASDILYEEHHAVLLPSVIERYLRPGGHWALSFAIRDAPMLLRFMRQMAAVGLLERETSEDGDENARRYKLAFDTACVRSKCEFCSKEEDHSCCEEGSWLEEAVAIFTPPRLITMNELWTILEAHEGGGIMMEARRPE